MITVLSSALLVAWPATALAQRDGGGVDFRIPGLVDVNVQWGQRSPINAPYVVQTRGPVHEAFAEPIVFDPQPGFLIPRRPPAPLEEVPPEIQPVGAGYWTWVPGYWAWDDDRNDFLWISGIWRNIPPGQQFVPGYWLEYSNGFQWVSGFWISDNVEAVAYLPQPPESLERGPTSPQPGHNFVWVPGTWLWRDVGYLWRPGYWMPAHQDWVWVPDHYVWAPSGYIFVNGYWDHTLPRRGLLFAPIYVATPVFEAPRFVYRPSVVVNVASLLYDFFARPRYSHYYFGDYYEREYFRSGIYPAYAFYDSDYGYDPIFATYVASQRAGRLDILQRYRNEYRFLRDNPRVRPPRTYSAFQQLSARRDIDPLLARRMDLVQPLARFSERRTDLPFRLERLESDRLSTYRDTIDRTRQYRQQRQDLERRYLREDRDRVDRRTDRTLPVPDRDRRADVSRRQLDIPDRPSTPPPQRVERDGLDRGRIERDGLDRDRFDRDRIDRDRLDRALPDAVPQRGTREPDRGVRTPSDDPGSPSIWRDELPRETQRELQERRSELRDRPLRDQGQDEDGQRFRERSPIERPEPRGTPSAVPDRRSPEQLSRRTAPDRVSPARPGSTDDRGEQVLSARPGEPPERSRTTTPPSVAQRGQEASPAREQAGQGRTPRSIERGQRDPVQLRLNRSPLAGRSSATQPAAEGQHGREQRVAPPARPRTDESQLQSETSFRSERRERRMPRED